MIYVVGFFVWFGLTFVGFAILDSASRADDEIER